jgi:ribonucleoside-diphosphate reductase alpha chain
MYVNEFFSLNDESVESLYNTPYSFGYDGYGEIVYYRTYSRETPNGNEVWPDTVLRVTNGTFTIRKDWYLKNNIFWDEVKWQKRATRFANNMLKMYWMPPGRGLWAMGTKFVYERGSMALNNCAFTYLHGTDEFANDCAWMMDALMLGCGVGFEPTKEKIDLSYNTRTFTYVIPDSREGWCRALYHKIQSHLGGPQVEFIYKLIRPKGVPIKGFGGRASGPGPLKDLLTNIDTYFQRYKSTGCLTRLKTDIANNIGTCVVAGNVRRSAELALGEIDDPVFLELKNYELNPDRATIGYMSNNTVKLYRDEDYTKLSEISKRVIVRGEPGGANIKNFSCGRVGKKTKVKDKARGLNPCGEITLEDKELCNVVETAPTVCPDWKEALEDATLYASTVSLLPTHSPQTNAVVTRNRRIGVSIMDYTGWLQSTPQSRIIRDLRDGYKHVRKVNAQLNAEAGVPAAIKCTTIKPGGTVPKLVGVTPGAGYPTFKYTLRRTRIAANHPMVERLAKANIPIEPEALDPKNTLVFSYPILQGPAEPNASLWEQMMNLITLQTEWADNSVSNTLYFIPEWETYKGEPTNAEDGVTYRDGYKCVVKGGWATTYKHNPVNEEHLIEKVLATGIRFIKSFSLLPHSRYGAYAQMPEEGITEEEYNKMKSTIKPIDWSNYHGSDGEDEKYCSGPTCVLPIPDQATT